MHEVCVLSELWLWIVADLADWECINRDSNYVAYRKLYKDTGLYQFKVIGQFDDITAKDFLDVQVSVACIWRMCTMKGVAAWQGMCVGLLTIQVSCIDTWDTSLFRDIRRM